MAEKTFNLTEYRNRVSSQLEKDISDEDKKRIALFQDRWNRYLGVYPDTMNPENYGKDVDGFDDNYKPNYAKLIVNKGAAFLFGNPPAFEIDAEKQVPEEEFLEKTWKQNKVKSLLLKAAINGGVTGQVFFRLTPGKPVPKIQLLDSCMITVKWSEEDIEDIYEYRIEWEGLNKQGKVVLRRIVIERVSGEPVLIPFLDSTKEIWRTRNEIMQDKGTWEPLGEPEIFPFNFCPIISCQNFPQPNSFWGLSDLEGDILHSISKSHFLASNIHKIIRYYAHPLTWGKGFNAGAVKRDVNNISVLPNKDAELHNLEMVSDLVAAIKTLELTKEDIYFLSQVPPIVLGKLENIGNLSGLALKILYAPIIERTEIKQTMYGELLTEMNKRLLEMGKFSGEYYPKNLWSSLVPGDEKTESETAAIDETLGVSKETLMGKLGYDAKREKALKAEEAQNDIQRFSQMKQNFQNGGFDNQQE